MKIHRLLSLAILLLAPLARAESPAPYALTKTLTLGGDGGWDYLTLSSDGKTLFIPRSANTLIVDTATGKITATIPGFVTPHGVALAPDLHRAFISDGDRKGNSGITLYDTTTNKTLAKIKTPPDSDGIILDPATNLIVCVSGDGNSVSSFPADIDPAAAKSPAPLALGGSPEFLAADGAGKIFINLSDKNQVAVLDAKNQKIIATYPTAPGGEPTGLAIDPINHRLFIGCRNPARLIVMSTDDGKILADFPIGAGVDAAAFDAPYAFASCADGTLTVIKQIDPTHYELAATIKTAKGARTMTVDPQTHTLYLAAADYDPASKAARPKPLPNSFKILVLTRTDHP